MACSKSVWYRVGIVVLLIGCMSLLPGEILQAAGQQAAEEGGYLASYSNAAPQEDSSSWLSTMAYVFTLLFSFVVVLALAYFASRFLGQKFGGFQLSRSSRILETLPLGTNRSLYVVEIAGKVMVIGVTNSQITLLEEITDEMAIARLKTEASSSTLAGESFGRLFEKQIFSLEQISRKFPDLFGGKAKK